MSVPTQNPGTQVPSGNNPSYGPINLVTPPKPLPSVGEIWFNILVLGWIVGLGLIRGVYKSVQGITRSREQKLSPAKYYAPLVAVGAVLLGLAVVGLVVGKHGPTSQAGSIQSHVSQVINQPPARVSASATAPAATTMPSTVEGRLALVKQLNGGVAATEMNGTPIDSNTPYADVQRMFNNMMKVMNKSVDFKDPRYLWGFYANPGDPKLAHYQEFVGEATQVSSSGHRLSLDYKLDGYAVFAKPANSLELSTTFTNIQGTVEHIKLDVQLIQGTWLITNDSVQ